MNDVTPTDKILGIEKSKYLKICYMLVLVAVGYWVLSNLLDLVGIAMPVRPLFGFIGLVGVGLSAAAMLGFRDDFSDMENTHFLFLVLFFIACLLANTFFGLIFGTLGVIGTLLMVALSVVEAFLLYAGYTLWQEKLAVTKDALIESIKALMDKFQKKA